MAKFTESKEKKLIRDKIIYEGKNCEKMTWYKKGTNISEIKAEHFKTMGKDDYK